MLSCSKILIYRHNQPMNGMQNPITDVHDFDSIPEAKEHWRNLYLSHLHSDWHDDKKEELVEGSWKNAHFYTDRGSYFWITFPKTQRQIREDKIDSVIES